MSSELQRGGAPCARAFIAVLTGPSGAGKTTIRKELVARHPEIAYSVSATTRARRPGEEEGGDYFFLTPEEFERRRLAGAFTEWAAVHRHFYGTPREFLERSLGEGRTVLLDVDIQGGARLRALHPEGVFVFVVPPSLEALRERLTRRGTEDGATARERLLQATKEMEAVRDYTYCVVNEDLETALGRIEAILIAERLRVARMPDPLRGLRGEPTGDGGSG